MKRRLVTGLLIACSSLGGLAATETKAQAQEIQLTGPLAGAPAVRHMRLHRQGRFNVAPALSFTLLDEYRRTIIAGGRLEYNFTEWLGVGIWGGAGAASLATDLTTQVDKTAPRNQFTANNVGKNFDAQTARISWMAVPQLTFIPFRGKLSLFQKVFVDTDFYVAAGPAFVGLQERKNCGGSTGLPCSDPASFALADRTAVTGSGALGLTFYIGEFVSLGVEYRAVPFSWNRAGFDSHSDTAGTRGGANFPDNKIDSADQTFQFNQMITIAVGFGLPLHPRNSD